MNDKHKHKAQIFTFSAIAVFGIGLAASAIGMAQSINDFRQSELSHTPEAILASAGVEQGSTISLPVSYYDQKQDPCVNLYDASSRDAIKARQFEWSSCDYHQQQIEQGLVDYKLSQDYLPVAIGGKLIPNRGLTDLSRWFGSVDGKSKEYTGNLKLTYRPGDNTEFVYTNNDFYPLDSADFSQSDSVNSDGHNHLFTMSFAIPFAASTNGSEAFKITADDDTFVFINDELVLDMGGIHKAISGSFTINEAGEVYSAVASQDLAFSGIRLERNVPAVIRIFHADRDSAGSVLRLKLSGMALNIVQSQLANGQEGIQVAYDPSNPSYIAPLGESTIVRPDSTKGQIIIATILGVIIVVSAIFIVILIRSLVRMRTVQQSSDKNSPT